jgi:hydroxymethylglutaryl-CoA lyase
MAFGNPYRDPWSVDEVLQACELIAECRITEISLADTVGLATPEQIADVLSAVIKEFNNIEIGVHLHARPADASERIRAAFQSGCRRFDSAIGGLGGCPFAQDILVGNIPTETLVAELHKHGASLPAFKSFEPLLHANEEISSCFGSIIQ